MKTRHLNSLLLHYEEQLAETERAISDQRQLIERLERTGETEAAHRAWPALQDMTQKQEAMKEERERVIVRIQQARSAR